MKKKELVYLQYIVVVVGGVLLFYFVTKYNKVRMEKAPKLDFEHAIDSVFVEKIDFGRGNFYLNRDLYNNVFVIGPYAKIHSEKETILLKDLPLPFWVTKKTNNDTLYLIKNHKIYHLLISKESRL